MRKAQVFVSGLVSVVCLATTAAVAAEGRIPIFAPGPIAGDGKYIVTRNLVGTGGAPVIDVSASNVDIDLNGMTISQPGVAAAVIMVSAPAGQVNIRKGTLVGGFAGIDSPGPGSAITIEDVMVQGSGGPGIHIFDIESIVIRRCTISGVVGDGILINGLLNHTGRIERNVIEDPGANGILFTNGNIAITDNSISSAGASGIAISPGTGCLISENTVAGSTSVGILVRGKGLKVFDNVVRENGSHGIHLDPGTVDSLVLNNVATSNGFTVPGGGHGLFVEGDTNLVERNTLNSNACFGLYFSPAGCANTFGRNMARGNTGACAAVFCGGPPALFPPQSCNGCAAPANSTFGDNLIPGPPIF